MKKLFLRIIFVKSMKTYIQTKQNQIFFWHYQLLYLNDDLQFIEKAFILYNVRAIF